MPRARKEKTTSASRRSGIEFRLTADAFWRAAAATAA